VSCHLVISGILRVLVTDCFSRKEIGIFFHIEYFLKSAQIFAGYAQEAKDRASQ
jgi:hypothetical protein